MAQLPDGTEIPDTLVPALQKAKLMDVLYENQATRKELLGLVKKHNPEVRIPEIDQPAEFEKTYAEPLRAEVTSLRDDIQKERAERARERELIRAQQAGLSGESIERAEKLISEGKVADWDTAVEHIRMSDQVSRPRTMPSPLELPQMEGLMANPAKWARAEAYRVINEIAGKR